MPIGIISAHLLMVINGIKTTKTGGLKFKKNCVWEKNPEMLQIDSTNQGLSNGMLQTFIQFVELIWHDCKV